MSSSAALLTLLRTAIIGQPLPLTESINWPEVLTLAQKQGVRGLVMEALQKIKAASDEKAQNSEATSSIERTFPSKSELMQLYAQTLAVEKHYTQHKAWAMQVAEMWKRKGLRTIVFKGMAHSRYYTEPSHREFGDFDCYLLNAEGQAGYQEGNDVAREAGLNVDDGWYKHSHIGYKGLTIENHQYFTAARRGGVDKALNRYLVEQIGDGQDLEEMASTGIYTLPLEAEGLFLLYHSQLHFLVEGINLRHFVDWAFWIKANQEKIAWAAFYKKCQQFRLNGFVDVMNTIAARHLGIQFTDPTVQANSPYAERAIESALYDESAIYNQGRGPWYERWSVIRNAFRYSWKYRHVAHYSRLGYVWQFVYGFLRHGEDD